MANDSVLYFHYNPIKHEVFYVGIGNKKRPYKLKSRTKWHKHVVAKYGIEVQIIKDNLSWEQAQVLEIFWIKTFGRKDLNEGSLVNLTDGGDGVKNIKNKIGPNKGKPMSQETKNKISLSKKNKPSHRKGVILSDATKLKMKLNYKNQW